MNTHALIFFWKYFSPSSLYLINTFPDFPEKYEEYSEVVFLNHLLDYLSITSLFRHPSITPHGVT